MRLFDIVSVGHFSIDSIFLPNKKTPYVVLGGSVAYVSFSAKHLDAKVSVISKVGYDFPAAYLWWLRQEGIDLSGLIKVEDSYTTCFELKYMDDLSDRTLRLRSKASPIAVKDLPANLRAKIIHIAPIAGEITYEVAEKLIDHGEILSLDPQGLLRSFDANGNVTLVPLEDKRILDYINIYKSSLTEIKAATGLSDLTQAIKAIHDHGVEIVVVTLGIEGVILSVEKCVYNIPAYKPEKVVDPTGAGDAFIGGLLAEYISNKDLLWCTCVGSAAASFVVEGVGPTTFGEKSEIYRRASLLYGKEIKE